MQASRWNMRTATRAIQDPRHYQIATLSLLLAYGLLFLDFDMDAARATLILATALSTQALCSRISGLPRFDPKSAFISGLSLCLLLRTNSPEIALAAAAAAVASKFIFRWHGKHIFNPTNFGLVVAIGLTGEAWVSPGQWGSAAFFAFLMACIGGLVIRRAARSDVTYAFVSAYVAILAARALWLGDPIWIPVHQLQNGAFLLFAFFMISDPKTTPDSRPGRILFAILVALGAGFVQFGLFRTNGLLWSLALFALGVPLIDRILPGGRYHWNRTGFSPRPLNDGASNEKEFGHRKPLPV
ncbi:MAG: RnfABCDGE type electron transport complex subunit D [Deltaproteobacteria bacterium]|nr:RnfABCDGE type electron transport complex subunit D [Deltaproteobacteria bacterium]